jgi:hypothetical protein
VIKLLSFLFAPANRAKPSEAEFTHRSLQLLRIGSDLDRMEFEIDINGMNARELDAVGWYLTNQATKLGGANYLSMQEQFRLVPPHEGIVVTGNTFVPHLEEA